MSRPWARRTLDVLGASALLVVALPLILLSAAASALVLRSWPIFVQERIGQGGRPFRFAKIRTLPTVTDPYVDKYHIPEARIPTVGRFLRRTKLDELPQLLLVLTGKMSLVGPRPEMPGLHQALDLEFARRRISVRPGCTGLWQLGPSSVGLIGEAPEYDEFYLRHRGPLLDLWILAQTLRTVAGRTPVPLESVPPWARRRERADGSVTGAEPAIASPVTVEERSLHAERRAPADLTLQRLDP